MSTATITPLAPVTGRVAPKIARPVRPAPVRGPLARPARTLPGPGGHRDRRAQVRSCRVDVAVPAGEWRLTDRGIALVLVLAGMIAVAAVAVVGLTAWQVTGSDYQARSAPVVSAR